MTTNAYDVVVLGAGAAGLLAATRAAERGLRTLLVEKNRKPGVKILMSGGTRCNLTHDATPAEIADAYARLAGKEKARFLRPALSHLTPDALIALFEAEGVTTKVEPTGKVFPASDRAIDVQQALLRLLERSGAQLSLDEPVTQLTAHEGRFALTTRHRAVEASHVILAVGGRSYPGCGTTGDGYAWAKAFGHRIVPPRPALVPLTADVESSGRWVAELRGLTLPDVRLRVREAEGPAVAERRGSLLFTHFGLSGPVAMDLSRFVTERPAGGWIAECDFLPSLDEQSLRETITQQTSVNGKRGVLGLVVEWIPRRLAELLVERAEIPSDRRLAELSKKELLALLATTKQTPIELHGSLGFKKAEVTAGGVDLSEIDPRTLQSRFVPGLYVAGEVLDLDGPIGGYNFQAAFSTGALAGDSVGV